jgi:hypothetical protein
MNKKPHVILHHTKKEETQDSSLSPEPKITNMFTHGSHGGIDDEYYINELIGLDDFTYNDWIGIGIGGDKRKEKKKEQLKLYKKMGFHLHHTMKEKK